MAFPSDAAPLGDILKGVGIFLSIVVSIPLITALVKASVFFGTITKTVDTLEKAASEGTKALNKFVERTEDRFLEVERVQNGHAERIGMLWDGYTDRRKADRRQPETGE